MLNLDVYAGLYWEGAPPTDIADRLSASIPLKLVKLLHQRVVKSIADADRYAHCSGQQQRLKGSCSDLLDGLRKRGFKLTMGEDDSGFVLLVWDKAGGYYLGDHYRLTES